MKINPYDEHNISLFGTGKDKPYICSMCGQRTTLNDSVSNRGYNLVCNRCLYKMQRILGRYDILSDIQRVGIEIQRTHDEEAKSYEDQ